MNKKCWLSLVLLCFVLIAALTTARPVEAQATVVFTSPVVPIDQGSSPVDFYGQIDNSQTGAVSIAPTLEQFSGDLSSFVTAYDSFGSTNNLPTSVAAGAVSNSLLFFSIDTSSLTPGTYSGALVLIDSSNNPLTNPANFSITVTAAPEPSIISGLALGASGLGVLRVRTRRRRAG